MLAGCATTPEGRLRHALVTEVYWDAARVCELRFSSIHMGKLGVNGDLDVSVDAGQTQDVPRFTACYWEGIAARVEKRRAAGLPIPDGFELKPDVAGGGD